MINEILQYCLVVRSPSGIFFQASLRGAGSTPECINIELQKKISSYTIFFTNSSILYRRAIDSSSQIASFGRIFQI